MITPGALLRGMDGVPAARLAPLALLLGLAVAWVVPQPGGVTLGETGGDRGEPAAGAVEAALDGLPADSVVALGFDADVGTYPEIRATVRTLIAQLLARDVLIGAVSLTPEGRALLLAELGRLERAGVADGSIVDLGFVPGAEAALVELTRGGLLPPRTADRRFARGVLAAADLAVVVGGNDMSPRAWVEQVLPRVDDLPLVVVAPTVLLPELLPFAETGQIDALLVGPRDGAAYRAGAAVDGPRQPAGVIEPEPRSLPVLIGLLVAIVVFVHAMASRVLQRARRVARDAE